jgi:hypothetical protein
MLLLTCRAGMPNPHIRCITAVCNTTCRSSYAPSIQHDEERFITLLLLTIPFLFFHMTIVKQSILSKYVFYYSAYYSALSRSFGHWGRGLESHSRHGCLSTFILCLCCPVQVAVLRRADPPPKESYRLFTRLRNWSETKRCTDVLRSRESNKEYDWMNDSALMFIYCRHEYVVTKIIALHCTVRIYLPCYLNFSESRDRWVWGNGEMVIIRGKSKKLKEKPSPVLHPPRISRSEKLRWNCLSYDTALFSL